MPAAAPIPQLVQAAAEVAAEASAAAAEVEAAGRLPERIVEALTRTGLYHLYLPASLGGPEADPVSALLAIERLARADGSVGWCAHVSSANAWQLAALAPEAVAEMGALTGGIRRFSGSARPLGRAERVSGGYRLTGQWDFASNCLHADWYCGATRVEDGGRRRVRALFVPIAEGKVVETWDVAGLRGTGSHDFAVEDVFVPDEHVAAGRHLAAQEGRLYRQRLTMAVNWAPTAGVALGIARGALDAFTVMSEQATANVTDTALRERPPTQAAVGRAAAQLNAARTYCLDALAELWEAAADAEADVGAELLEARLAITHAMHTAVEVVDTLFHAGGTRSIFAREGLERRFRDAHVAVQHGAGAPAHFEAGGRVLLGLPAAAPFW